MRTVMVQVGVGAMRVATVEQTLVDLVARPDLGGMPEQAAQAAADLARRADPGELHDVLATMPRAAARRVAAVLPGVPAVV